jgi:hypothetical protein
LGMVDDLGPYSGDVEGDLTSESTAEGVVPIEIVEGDELELPWSGTFGPDGSFTGEFEGTESIYVDPLSTDVVIDFEGDFEANKID